MEPLTSHSSSPLDRRECLRVAAGLGLSFALPGMDPRASESRGPARQKSLVIVWLEGGASQLETWDPHPGSKTGGPTRAIATKVSGLEIAEHFPRMAEQVHHLSVIRSLVSKEGDHDRAAHYARTGYQPDPTITHPSLGSIVVRERPTQGLDLPPFISLGYTQHTSRGGYLGGQYDAFSVREPGGPTRIESLTRDDRQRRRLENLEVVTGAFSKNRKLSVERTLYRETLDATLKMMSSEQLQAFDLEQEPQAVRAAYGDTAVGQACLAARRLIEQGVRSIEVSHLNYDTHENNFQSHRTLAGELDPALAALVNDLRQRDLLDSTVILCLGEFGRTPAINQQDGRDHWPSGYSCLLGGGGLAAGVVLGATDPSGVRKEPDDPIAMPDLSATVLAALGVDFARSGITPIGRPMKYSEGKAIARLLA